MGSQNSQANVLQEIKTIFLIIHYIDISFYPSIQQSSKKTNLNNLGIKTVTNSSKTKGNLINHQNNNTYIESRAEVYKILFLDS